MRKFYSCLVIAILSIIGLQASAAEYTVTLNIDNPANVSLEKGWANYVDLIAGDNTLVLDPDNSGLYYTLSANDGCFIGDVNAVDASGAPLDLYWSPTSLYLQNYNVPAGSVITVTTGDYASGRTATATLNVDNASMIRVQYEGSYYAPEITDGANVLTFNPTGESTWTITTTNYEPAYKVTLDGTEVPCMYGYRYELQGVADGSVIDVQVEFPELAAEVNITTPAGADDIIGGVKVNGQWAADWTNITATTGDKIIVYPNNLKYTNLQASVNGTPTYMYNSLEVTVNAEVMDIDITGEVDPEATDVTLVLDDASAVTVCANYADGFVIPGLVTGSNTLKLRNYVTIDVTANDGVMITKATRDNTPLEIYGMTNVSLNYTTEYGACTYSITTGDLNALRTATVTVTVDDPAKVDFRMNTGKRTLAAGSNTLKFMPGEESEVCISPADNDAQLYSVSLNGQQLTADYGSYMFDIADGDAIDIQANFPEGTGHITFVYPNAEGEAYITNVEVNGSPVDNFNAGFDANIGDKVTIYGDYYSDFVLVSMLVNDEDVTRDFWGQYEFVVRGDTEVTIDAHHARTVTATIIVDNADAVQAYYYNEYYEREMIQLSDGSVNFSISELSNPLNICATTGNSLKTVTANGVAQTIDTSWSGDQFCEVNVREGMVIEVTTGGGREADQDVMIYLGEGSYSYVSIQDKDQINEVYFEFFEDGVGEPFYMQGNFAAQDNPLTFNIGTSDGSQVYVYLNNEPLTSTSTNSNFVAQQSVADGDVIKIYNHEPATYTVTFDVQNATDFDVIADFITPVNTANTLQVLEGTAIVVTDNSADQSITVTTDGLPVVADDNQYGVEITADTTITIAGTTGLESLGTANTLNTVYNLQGVLIMRNATAAQVRALPAGLYIVNGQKVLVK